MTAPALVEKALGSINLPDAMYLADRLAACKPAGVLSPDSALETKDWDGAGLCFEDAAGNIVLVGMVRFQYRSIQYQSGATAVERLGEVIGPNQAREYLGAIGPIYFHALEMSEYYGGAGAPPETGETPELMPAGVMKVKPGGQLDLNQLPTSLLHTTFAQLEREFESGVFRADRRPEQIQTDGREVFEVLQKRIPHLKADSPLLESPKPSVPHISRIAKVADTEDPEWMYVLSMVLQPNDGKEGADLKIDYDDEVYNKHFIRKIAYPYVHKFRGLGIMHAGERVEEEIARVVQSYVVDDDFTVTVPDGTVYGEGTWFLGAEVKRDSDLGRDIESGKLRAWSIHGLAIKVPEQVAA